jgi:hypothetical protein
MLDELIDMLDELIDMRDELNAEVITLRLVLELLELPGALEQTVPVTTGRCAGLLATPLLPCTPNSTDWPGLIWLFQPTPVAL